MGYNRPQAKWLARNAMRGAYPHPMLVTLVYVLLTGVLGSMVLNFAAEPFQAAYFYLTETNYEAVEILTAIFTPQRIAVLLVMELLLALYNWVMSYGYASYCLRLARREGPGYRNLLDGFYTIGRAIAVNFLSALFVFLWSLLGVAIYAGLVVLAYLTHISLLIVVGALIAAVWMIAVSYRYRLAVYFLLDHPEMGTLESLRHSRDAMRGNAVELFVQDLSFLGWLILSPFTLGILSLWVAPYMGAANANFYSWVVYGSFPQAPQPGGWTGPYGGM